MYVAGREERYGDRRDRDRRDRERERERERENRDRGRDRNGEEGAQEKTERIPHADRNLEEKAIKVKCAHKSPEFGQIRKKSF